MTEKNLIKGLRDGAYESYEALFKTYYAKFVHYAESLVGDPDAARDLVQEAFMKIWLNRDRLREDLSMNNYLFVLVRRASLNFIRDRKIAEAIDDDIEDISPDAVSTLDDAERMDRLKTAVESLPDRRREVFKLSREEGLQNKEIARQLNISEKTVERHMTLALREIRNKFNS